MRCHRARSRGDAKKRGVVRGRRRRGIRAARREGSRGSRRFGGSTTFAIGGCAAFWIRESTTPIDGSCAASAAPPLSPRRGPVRASRPFQIRESGSHQRTLRHCGPISTPPCKSLVSMTNHFAHERHGVVVFDRLLLLHALVVLVDCEKHFPKVARIDVLFAMTAKTRMNPLAKTHSVKTRAS